MADEAQSSREELLEAREQIKRQLELVENPLRFTDQNPQLAARLRAMLADIDNSLNNAQGR
jgi:hypothetical protein